MNNATVLHLHPPDLATSSSVLDDVIFINQGRSSSTSSVDQIREKKDKTVDALFREVFRC